jgi:hypothetical protein
MTRLGEMTAGEPITGLCATAAEPVGAPGKPGLRPAAGGMDRRSDGHHRVPALVPVLWMTLFNLTALLGGLQWWKQGRRAAGAEL